MAESEYTPTLTLNPTAAPAQEAPAAPVLTTKTEEEKPEAEKLEIDRLSPSEQAAVREFAKQIDVTDTNLVLAYGSGAQKNISEFSSQALGKVRTKDMGPVGDMLSDLVVELKTLEFEEEEKKKGLGKLFHKAKDTIEETKAKFDKAEVNVDRITAELEKHQVVLSKDIATMDQMFELNQAYFKELTMYIIAGKLRVQELREGELKELRDKAAQSGLAEDAQAANDFAELIGRFEKKIHDLELTRVVSVQMGPQTRLLQNNDTLMIEKIQSSLVNTIPLWKSQMVLALGMEHSRQATAAQSDVTEMTNELVKKNAEALKMGTIATAKEAERSIIDIETLQHTNEQLISSLDEVMNIQREGAAKRKAAEAELGRIEGELKQKLLELRG